MKRTYRQINGKLVEVTPRKRLAMFQIMPDITPYASMITGEKIRSRNQHKQHLRDHECQEVGDQVDQHFHAYDDLHSPLDKERHEIIKAQINDMTDKQFNRAIQKSIREARGY